MKKRLFNYFLVCLTFMLLLFSVPIPTKVSSATRAIYYSGSAALYLNNANTGGYLQNANGSLTASSGVLSNLGNTIKWQMEYVENDYYVIRSVADPTLYVAASSNASSATIYFTTLSDSSIPNRYRWRVYLGSGGCILKNMHTNKYLCISNGVVSSKSTLGDSDTAEYKQKVWRIADSVSYYGAGIAYDYVELPSRHKFKTLHLFANERACPQLADIYEDVLWGTADNFTFTGYSTNYVTLDPTSGYFTALSSTSLYSTTITATHKVTGRTSTFSLVINPKVILVGVDAEVEHDHSSVLSSARANLLQCGYSGADVHTGEFSINSIDTYLDTNTNDVFVYRGHGGLSTADGIQVGTCIYLDADYNVRYRSNDSMSDLDLSNMSLMMFIACKTAVGGNGGLNLPTVAVQCGARTAVGFEEDLDCPTANDWTESFFLLLQQGVSIHAACAQLAASQTYINTSMTSYVICGYSGLRLN